MVQKVVVLYRFDCIWQKRRLSVKIDYHFTSPKQKKRRLGFKLFLNLTEKNKELADERIGNSQTQNRGEA